MGPGDTRSVSGTARYHFKKKERVVNTARLHEECSTKILEKEKRGSDLERRRRFHFRQARCRRRGSLRWPSLRFGGRAEGDSAARSQQIVLRPAKGSETWTWLGLGQRVEMQAFVLHVMLAYTPLLMLMMMLTKPTTDTPPDDSTTNSRDAAQPTRTTATATVMVPRPVSAMDSEHCAVPGKAACDPRSSRACCVGIQR
eukprot:3938694-Rhodomonas_salina.2